jgi:hypothetical protein
MHPEVTAFFDEATFTVTYVVRDPQQRLACAIVDSVLDFDYASGRTDTARPMPSSPMSGQGL